MERAERGNISLLAELTLDIRAVYIAGLSRVQFVLIAYENL